MLDCATACGRRRWARLLAVTSGCPCKSAPHERGHWPLILALVRALEAHVGVAGLFNRLGFSGAYLGTVGAAVLVLLIGVYALERGLPSIQLVR